MQLNLIFQNLTPQDIKKSFKERTRKDVIDEFYELIIKQAKEGQELARFIQRETGVKQKIWPLPLYVKIAMALQGLQTVQELENFLGYCKEAKHFSKCFYSQTRVDKK